MGDPDRLDQFARQQAKGNWNHDIITTGIYNARKTYELGQNGLHVHFKRSSLAIQADILDDFPHQQYYTCKSHIICSPEDHAVNLVFSESKTSGYSTSDLQ